MRSFAYFMLILLAIYAVIGLSGQYVTIKNLKAELGESTVMATEMAGKVKTLEAELAEAKDVVMEYTAVASWYGPGFHGRRAADGSIYDQGAYTIAHKTLPFGTIVVLEYRGRRVPAVVTDRGPYIAGRDFDLSLGLAKRLGLVTKGVDEIRVYQIDVGK